MKEVIAVTPTHVCTIIRPGVKCLLVLTSCVCFTGPFAHCRAWEQSTRQVGHKLVVANIVCLGLPFRSWWYITRGAAKLFQFKSHSSRQTLLLLPLLIYAFHRFHMRPCFLLLVGQNIYIYIDAPSTVTRILFESSLTVCNHCTAIQNLFNVEN